MRRHGANLGTTGQVGCLGLGSFRYAYQATWGLYGSHSGHAASEGIGMKIFESELRGKTVMSDEGAFLGILRNATVNEQTGDLLSILVEPSDEIDVRLYHQNPEGRIVFPFDNVRSVRDVIIVATN